MRMCCAFLVAVYMIIVGCCFAAVPQKMNYQGKLTDADGKLVSDGDYDMVVCCPDKPFNGTYFFENTRGNIKMPVFKPAVKVGTGHRNIRPSYVDGKVRLLLPGREIENPQTFDRILDDRT